MAEWDGLGNSGHGHGQRLAAGAADRLEKRDVAAQRGKMDVSLNCGHLELGDDALTPIEVNCHGQKI